MMRAILDTFKAALSQVRVGWKYYLVPALALSLFSESMLGSSSLETGMDFRGLFSLGLSNGNMSLAIIYVVLSLLISLALISTAWAKYHSIVADDTTEKGLLIPRKDNVKLRPLFRLVLADALLYAGVFAGYILFVLAEFVVALLPESIASVAGVIVLVVSFSLAIMTFSVALSLLGIAQVEIVNNKRAVLTAYKKSWVLLRRKPVVSVVFGLVTGSFVTLACWMLATLVSVFFELIVLTSANNLVYVLLSFIAWALYSAVALVSGYIMVTGLVAWRLWQQQLVAMEIVKKKRAKK